MLVETKPAPAPEPLPRRNPGETFRKPPATVGKPKPVPQPNGDDLAQLLAEHAAEIVELDPAIFGSRADLYLGLVVEAQGRWILAMPAGQDPHVRAQVVRQLLTRQAARCV